MSETPTPRTDDAETHIDDCRAAYVVPTDFARELERESAELLSVVREFTEDESGCSERLWNMARAAITKIESRK